jgi:hypothetical protein
LELETLTVVQVAEKINRVQKVFSSWLASLPIFLPCSFPCKLSRMPDEAPPPRSPTELFTGCLLIQLKLHYTRQLSRADGELAGPAPRQPLLLPPAHAPHARLASSARQGSNEAFECQNPPLDYQFCPFRPLCRCTTCSLCISCSSMHFILGLRASLLQTDV